MLVAKQKRKENIAEYILYLYQIEDMIRALQFDMDLIDQKLVTAYNADENTSKEISNWYRNLVIMMEKEGIREKGHLQVLINLIDDINDFHMNLVQTRADARYVQVFQLIAGLLGELRVKNTSAQNDVQLAIDTIYGFLLLKMKNSLVTDETSEAVQRLGRWLGTLSKLYREFETGEFNF